jgi:hypothetical protein
VRAVRHASRLPAAALLAAFAACAPPPLAMPEPLLSPEPSPDAVGRVLFLLGDPGAVTTATSPVFQRLQADVEWWSARLRGDSTVAILVLGDIVYPAGLNPPDSDAFPRDTAILMSQVRLVAGPAARARRAPVYFVPGNHDWGLRRHVAGAVRLARMAAFIDSAGAAEDLPVRLVPAAGTGGPFVWDWGPDVRLLLLDTAWWLLGAEDADETPFLARVEEAVRTAGDREILFAAHHPFRSAGPHGGEVTLRQTFGLKFLLQRAGAILQDLTSGPYRDLERGLRAIFARHRTPLLFIGGHEHSLQVFERLEPTDPAYSLVSGSGAKLSAVGVRPGLLFARSAPGYMRVLVTRDGRMHLSVEATGEAYRECAGEDEAAAACLAEGLAAFATVHSQPLR